MKTLLYIFITFFSTILIVYNCSNDVTDTIVPTPTPIAIEINDVIGTVYVEDEQGSEDTIIQLIFLSGILSGPHYKIDIIGDKKQELLEHNLKWIEANGTFYIPDEYASQFDNEDMVTYGLVDEFDITDYTIETECRTVKIRQEGLDYYITYDAVDYIINWENSNTLSDTLEDFYNDYIDIAESNNRCLCGAFNYLDEGQSFITFDNWIYPYGFLANNASCEDCSEATLY